MHRPSRELQRAAPLLLETARYSITGADRLAPEPPEAVSLYAHIPFCRTRCSYCAFNTYAGLEGLIESFVQSLCREIQGVGAQAVSIGTAHTLYFGGGTPSLLEPTQVQKVIRACQSGFQLARHAEITLEVNPGTIDLAKMVAFRQAGVNRISLGVQSAHAGELALFGRSHTFTEASAAFQMARRAGFNNISVDLIYGAPTQTRPGWNDTLAQVLAWQPDHLSLYSLSVEPQTLLERQIRSGLLPAPDADLAADMYEDALERAAQAGLIQYEISNWARQGCESRHNCQYWLNRPFLGFGPGAHGAAAGVRYWNVKSVHEYTRRVNEGEPSPFPFSPARADHESINWKTSMAETMILGLRLVRDGVDREDFAARFGSHPEEVYGPQIADLKRLGLLEEWGNSLRLTPRAYLISNRVFVRFMPEADE